jgi:hypothetical protein
MMEITKNEFYAELFKITVMFLNEPIKLLELWNRDKNDNSKDMVNFTKDLKTYINYRYTMFIGECHSLIFLLLLEGKINDNFLLDDNVNLPRIVSFYIDASQHNELCQKFPMLKEFNIKKLNTKFYNKLLNIKFDKPLLTEAGYIFTHLNNKNVEKHNLKLIK